ncbi:hypothetical protein RclHR1_08780004 [Rhizophagus clarus]|uniref:TLDc domain-containing protein n=1 Tax=Rhizophagus clarus TaxID=94130 RepID=A0A2Z6S8D2_9GLOM|nr:hypothetical protein RclHR1_08780004 [Rhizophagus clarus]
MTCYDQYIYGGRLSFEGYDMADVIKTLVAANELELQELVNHLQSFLIQKNTSWIVKNFSLIYQTSLENDSLSELQNYCNELISKKPEKIINSLNFTSIPEKILISLIQNDNLIMNEVQVWNHVLKWGLNQNPGLPSNPESFSEDDISALRNTLKQCIPLIKFDDFTSKEFLDNVFPYREILPEKLFIDLLKLFLDYDHKEINQVELDEAKEIEPEPLKFDKIENESTDVRNIPIIEPSTYRYVRNIPNIGPSTNARNIPNIESSTNVINIPNSGPSTSVRNIPNIVPQIFNAPWLNDISSINSTIITSEHIRIISKWIDRLDFNASYEFKLIFRGSRNGFKSKKFHEICDNQPCTVTIIKVKGSNEILGGYNPLEWKSDGRYATTNDSFLFSFDKNQGIENHILSRVKSSKFAISNDSNRGPSFGESDLILRGSKVYNNSVCTKKSYEKQIRIINSRFSVEEYEIFQVTKKFF